MISENLKIIRKNIDSALEKSHRDTPVIVVGVSKNRSIEQILEAHMCGIADFGENRLQEAEEKIPGIPRSKIKWHFIGRLQDNKVKKAVQLFDSIHSVDSLELAKRINEQALALKKVQEVLVQINISDEPTKSGFSELEIIGVFDKLLELDNLSISGLMAIAPLADDPEQTRPVFACLRQLRDKLEEQHSVFLPELSMGMSQDYVVAVEEGATMVRIGTALFGARS